MQQYRIYTQNTQCPIITVYTVDYIVQQFTNFNFNFNFTNFLFNFTNFCTSTSRTNFPQAPMQNTWFGSILQIFALVVQISPIQNTWFGSILQIFALVVQIPPHTKYVVWFNFTNFWTSFTKKISTKLYRCHILYRYRIQRSTVPV